MELTDDTDGTSGHVTRGWQDLEELRDELDEDEYVATKEETGRYIYLRL